MTNEEINHRLATEVMGWDVVTKNNRLWRRMQYKNPNMGTYLEPIDRGGRLFWSPTDDEHLHQTMMCVEKMVADGFRFSLNNGQLDKKLWLCVIGSSCKKDYSPALAICKAIIEALDSRSE